MFVFDTWIDYLHELKPATHACIEPLVLAITHCCHQDPDVWVLFRVQRMLIILNNLLGLSYFTISQGRPLVKREH